MSIFLIDYTPPSISGYTGNTATASFNAIDSYQWHQGDVVAESSVVSVYGGQENMIGVQPTVGTQVYTSYERPTANNSYVWKSLTCATENTGDPYADIINWTWMVGMQGLSATPTEGIWFQNSLELGGNSTRLFEVLYKTVTGDNTKYIIEVTIDGDIVLDTIYDITQVPDFKPNLFVSLTYNIVTGHWTSNIQIMWELNAAPARGYFVDVLQYTVGDKSAHPEFYGQELWEKHDYPQVLLGAYNYRYRQYFKDNFDRGIKNVYAQNWPRWVVSDSGYTRQIQLSATQSVSFILEKWMNGGNLYLDNVDVGNSLNISDFMNGTVDIPINVGDCFVLNGYTPNSITGYNGQLTTASVDVTENCPGGLRISYDWYAAGVHIGTADNVTFALDLDRDDGNDLTCEMYIGADFWQTVTIPMTVNVCHALFAQTTSINGYEFQVVNPFVQTTICSGGAAMTYSWHIQGSGTILSTAKTFPLTLLSSYDGEFLVCDMNNGVTMVPIPITVDGCYNLTDQTESITGDVNTEAFAYIDYDVCEEGEPLLKSWYVDVLPNDELGTGDNVTFTLTNQMNGNFLICETTPDIGVTPIPITVNDCPKLLDQTDFIIGDIGSLQNAFVTTISCDSKPISYRWYIDANSGVTLGTDATVDFTLTAFMNGRNLICETIPNVNVEPIPITVANLPPNPDYWYFRTVQGEFFPIRARTDTPEVMINYELRELSSGRTKSIDRGVLSDRYSADITFSDSRTYMYELVRELEELRVNKLPVIMGGFQQDVNPFGDHLNYSGEISCLIDGWGELNSKQLGQYDLTITFLATEVEYDGTPEIPVGMKCLQNDYLTASDWNTSINESYYGNNWFVDRVVDKYYYEGEYLLTTEENRNLFTFWKDQRGNAFTVQESDFGVTNMFGPTFLGESQYRVVIIGIEYEVISPVLRRTKITLLKEA